MNNSFTLFGQIQTSQTGGRSYSDISTYGECYLFKLKNFLSIDIFNIDPILSNYANLYSK